MCDIIGEIYYFEEEFRSMYPQCDAEIKKGGFELYCHHFEEVGEVGVGYLKECDGVYFCSNSISLPYKENGSFTLNKEYLAEEMRLMVVHLKSSVRRGCTGVRCFDETVKPISK